MPAHGHSSFFVFGELEHRQTWTPELLRPKPSIMTAGEGGAILVARKMQSIQTKLCAKQCV